MGIVDEDVARVRDQCDLVALVSRHLALKRVGGSWMGLCPFHGEKSPSFSVSPEKGFFHCFGCGKSGDAITFCMEIEHLDFVGAVEKLAAASGITLHYDARAQSEGRRERARLVEAMGAAVEWYHERLLTADDAGPARSYLRSRGFDGDTVRRYRLGWAPDDWDALARAHGSLGPSLERAGLVFVNRRGRRQDFFRNRLLFPIFDAQGDPVSFGGRILPGADGPKYRNTSETPLYHKSRVLYGLNWAKSSVVAADRVIICEGYTDVIGFAAAGLDRAVATCGTALTEEHVKMLRKFARGMVLAFDPDTAGKAAADRVYAWERTHDIDVTVVELPGGSDPADLARQDPEALRAAVEGAKPFLAYRVGRVLGAGNSTTAEGRARTAEAALAVIAEHPSDLVRDQYVMEVADRCRLDPDKLRERLMRGDFDRSPEATRRAEEAPAGPPRRRHPGGGVESEALRLVVHRGLEMAELISSDLFGDAAHRDVFDALVDADFDPHRAVGTLDPDAAELLAALAVDASDAEVVDVASRLVAESGRARLAELQREARGADDPLAYSPSITWLKLQLESLREDPESALVAGGELVRWLSRNEGERHERSG